MQNAKFCLLPQTAFAMLNTTSQLLMVRRTVPESCQGSEYGQFPDLWMCKFAAVPILLHQNEALMFQFFRSAGS